MTNNQILNIADSIIDQLHAAQEKIKELSKSIDELRTMLTIPADTYSALVRARLEETD